MAKLEETMSRNPLDVAEEYLRKHYSADCAQYDPMELRLWIKGALPMVGFASDRSINEVLFELGMRWVLRDWFVVPTPPTPKTPGVDDK